MARVRDLSVEEVPEDVRTLYRQFSSEYGNFANQVKVLAHAPLALRHLYGLLFEWREQMSLPRRLVEIAVVTVSRLNRCSYCVTHHAPALVDLGILPEAVEQILEPLPAGFAPVDLLVRDYARLVIERPSRISDNTFADLKNMFTERQIVELTLRISLCGLFNQLNEALQIELEEGELDVALSRGLSAP